MTGQQSFGTGDINLAAAILAMGVPPAASESVKLIACENGKDYARFHVESCSLDGNTTTERLMKAWTDPESFHKSHPLDPFSVLMKFIASRPRGCSNKDQWIEHAASFLGVSRDAVRTILRDINTVCKVSPESSASYVCAFIQNRLDLIGAAKRAESAGNIKNMMTHGKAFGLIPAKGPKRILQYLKSALTQ